MERSAPVYEAPVVLSVCATNYNCAHALERHLESVSRVLAGIPFEYVIVDNLSADGSWEILSRWARVHPWLQLLRRRCTMGSGRNLAVAVSRGPWLLVVDTDVVYYPALRPFVETWTRDHVGLAVQAPMAGLFPRDIWETVGGRRSLNTYEDVDAWLRIHALGRMRWYPVPMGENLKETEALGGLDHLSARYGTGERLLRLIRREWDLWKTRSYEGIDVEAIIRAHSVDLGLGVPLSPWVTFRPKASVTERTRAFGRLLFQLLRR